jgi:hypothetical protein
MSHAPGDWPAFLTTFKPMLKRARGTPSYEDMRVLLRLWSHHKRVRRLLDAQNTRLYQAAAERDHLLALLNTKT